MADRRGSQGRSGGTGLVAVAFLASIAGSIGFITAYQLGGNTQVLGGALVVALAGLGCGLVWWSRRLMPQEQEIEPRPDLTPPADEQQDTATAFRHGARGVGRRGLLGTLLGGALGAFGLGALWPARSLGPRPAEGLGETGWAEGVHLVDAGGARIAVDALDFGGVLTVFPEGRSPGADDQVILLRMPLSELALPGGRERWVPEGNLAYSKVCTHAGCPVGLYQDVGHLLLCPCHQATFDASRGCPPIFGPAARALPQLPLTVGPDGTLVAAGPFTGPVGPDRWRTGGDGEIGT